MHRARAAIAARKYIVRIGKYSPFAIVALSTVSNIEAAASVILGRYADYNGDTIYYKPFSWFVGRLFEIDYTTVVLFLILSIGVEACVWNRLSVMFLAATVIQKDILINITIDERTFFAILIANIFAGIGLVYKGIVVKC